MLKQALLLHLIRPMGGCRRWPYKRGPWPTTVSAFWSEQVKRGCSAAPPVEPPPPPWVDPCGAAFEQWAARFSLPTGEIGGAGRQTPCGSTGKQGGGETGWQQVKKAAEPPAAARNPIQADWMVEVRG